MEELFCFFKYSPDKYPYIIFIFYDDKYEYHTTANLKPLW